MAAKEEEEEDGEYELRRGHNELPPMRQSDLTNNADKYYKSAETCLLLFLFMGT